MDEQKILLLKLDILRIKYHHVFIPYKSNLYISGSERSTTFRILRILHHNFIKYREE
jgi:hypothetical protein